MAADLSGGTLTIHSEPVPGAVPTTIVSQSQQQVTVWQDGNETTFSQNQVRRIVFHGTNQKDSFDNRTDISATVYGNGGNDTLRAGAAHDVIYGGSGNDTIIFERGGGVAYGQAGNDTITAYGDNQITAYGGRGRDTITGGNEDDKLYGGLGNDTIRGGSGDDFISGGRGNDHLWDGDGKDTVLGGGGVDRFYMEYGYRDDGDLDRISLGGWAQLKNETHFARDYEFSMNGYLNEGKFRR
ncbi:calcium-binding protein [Planctomycetaceae bacterium SH139]